ncbi:MAG: hypothetical protein WBP79_01040 [Candidatus Acidiferrales bacterium]
MSSAPVPPKGGNNALWWILGIVAGGIVVLVFLGLLLAGVMIRHINVSESGNKVAIETPVGAIKVNTGDAHTTGLPVYPGATAKDDQNTNVEISAADAAVGIATEEYQSKDSIDKVQEWYRKRLGPDFRLESSNDKSNDSWKITTHAGEHDIAFVNDRGDGARVVALEKSFAGTKIKLVRVGKRETQ